MEETCVKYAVYQSTGGEDSLHVVVDSLEAAKKEAEPLKTTATRYRIDECTVENFGKDNEKTVSSKTIDTWKKEGEGSKLSDKSKVEVAAAPIVAAVSTTETESTTDETKLADGGVAEPELTKEEKVKEFMEYYEHNGGLFGMSYWIKKEKPVEKVKEKEEPKTEDKPIEEKTEGGESNDDGDGDNGVEDDVPEKEEVKKDGGDVGDKKETEDDGEYISADEFIKKTGAKKIKVDKNSKIYFLIDGNQ